MEQEVKDWNKKVWILNIAEAKLKENKPNFNKTKLSKIRKLINEAWMKIWDLHPYQHPDSIEKFHKFFDTTQKDGETQ